MAPRAPTLTPGKRRTMAASAARKANARARLERRLLEHFDPGRSMDPVLRDRCVAAMVSAHFAVWPPRKQG